MDDVDVLGYAAWVEYYDQIKIRTEIRRNERLGYANNKYYKRFRQIGEQCKAEGIDPADYIRVAFDLVRKNFKYFTPVDFTNPNLFQMYKTHKATYGTRYLTAWANQVQNLVQIECLRTMATESETEEDVLCNGAQALTAWFRLFYLPTFSERVYSSFGKAAWAELQDDKPLRMFLREKRRAHMEELEKRIGYFGDLKDGDILNGATKQCVQS